MDLNHISLRITNNYWMYVLNSHSITDFKNYSKPYFVIPNNENIKNEDIKAGDIIIMIVQEAMCYKFIGFVQINSVPEKNKKIKIFRDINLNFECVSLNFRLICNESRKLSLILKQLNIQEKEFKTGAEFTKKFAKKHFIMCSFPSRHGRLLVKLLISLNNTDSNSDNESIPEDSPIKKIKTIKTKTKKSIKKKPVSSSSSATKESNDESIEGTESDTIELGMIPVMMIPCPNFNIVDAKNNVQYFIDHYKSCNKCSYTNNNNIELGAVIDKSNFEYHEITESFHEYFNSALDCYSLGQKYEPINHAEIPFVRLLYINNEHDFYDNCLLICWIIE